MLDFADGVPQQLHSMYAQICPTWWERLILLMEEILHQLIASLSDYPIICRVLYIPGGAGVLPSTVLLHPERYFWVENEYESMNKKYYYDLFNSLH